MQIWSRDPVIELHFLFSDIVSLQYLPLLTLKMKMREFFYETSQSSFYIIYQRDNLTASCSYDAFTLL